MKFPRLSASVTIVVMGLLHCCTPAKENEVSDVQTVQKIDAFQRKKLSKADRIDLAFKQEFDKTRDPATLSIPRERLINGIEIIRRRRNARTAAKATGLTWEERGPYNVGGRTKAILWDPQITDKVWAGAASGGLWYNTDITNSASEWTAVDDLMENLSITSIAYDPVDPDVMYMGTGEGHIIGSVKGAGMLKSTDAGVTWTHMTTSNGFYDTEGDFHYVNDILVVDEGGLEGVIYVATQSSMNEYTYFGYALSGENGLWRSTDGGVTFTQQLANVSGESYTYPMGDLELGADGRIWAGTARDIFGAATARIYYSDNGTTWNVAYDPGSGDRVELATAPTDANRVYAVAANGGSVAWMVSATSATSSPTSWSSITTPTHQDPISFGGACTVNCSNSGDFTRSSQAFYDLILKVDPTDEDKVWAGGIDLHQSTDGGSTWDAMTSWYDAGAGTGCDCLPYVHADMHVLEFNPLDDTELLSGNDGGVHFTTNANAATPSWDDRNNNYNVTQFYGGAINPTAGTNQFLGGAQDNGSQYFSGTGMITTSEASGGDGAYCNIDQDEAQYQWTQYVYNDYYCSTNTGASFPSTREFGSSTGRFINPSVYDNTENIMYAAGGTNQFLRWTNPQSCGATGSFINSSFGGDVVSALAVSPNISNRVYFGTGNNGISDTGSGNVYYVDNAHNSSAATDISGASFPANSYVSCIAIEDGDENHIIVTFSNYGVSSVWETTDGGSNWTDIEGDLPDMPVRWAIIHPEDANRVILATELGVWSTDNTNGGSTDWEPHDDESFPHVRTDMLQVRASDLEMIALTHGRGLWSTNIALPTTSDPEISFVTATATQTETTTSTNGCQYYTDYTVSMEIANPPTGDATVTLAVDGASTASEGYDFDFTTTDFTSPSSDLVFADGATANQTFTLRVYNDDAIESSETVVFDYSLSGPTDAVAGAADQTYTLTIEDNDQAPTASSITYLMQEDFESYANYSALTTAGWAQGSFGGTNTNQWTLGSDGALNGSSGIYISDDASTHNYDATGASQMGMISPVMDGTGLTNITLDFNYICNGELFSGTYYDYGGLLYIVDANDNGNVFDDGSFTLFETNIQGISSSSSYSTTLPAAVENTKFAIGFYWVNDGSVANQPPFAVDDIEIYSGVSGVSIASTTSQTYSTNFGPNETIYFYDDASGDILLSLENLSSWDYGCTDVTITQDGTGAMTMNSMASTAYPASKILSITPTTNNPSGEYTITMYYSDAEITGWMSATGNGTGDLDLVKVEGSFDANVASGGSSSWEANTPSIGSFGSDYTFSTTFNSGFSTFGVANTDDWVGPVPVEWVYFRAAEKNGMVELSWQTASEQNADKFLVEYSFDGENYDQIGSVIAAGESSELLSYNFEHNSPKKGVNYYRLKQIDFDGQFEYSEIKTVTIRPMSFAVAEVYPNPASDILRINFSTEVANTKIDILSIDGKVIRSRAIKNIGENMTEELAVSDLKRGIYFIRVSDGFDSVIQKVLLH